MTLSATTDPLSAASDDPAAAHAAWRSERLLQVSGRTGAAALINYVPVDATEREIPEFPLSAWRIAEEPGVRVRAHTVGVTLRTGAGERELTPGVETFVERLGADGFPLIEYDRFTIDAFSLDGTDFELRVYDAEAPTVTSLTGIDTNPYDPAWVLSGTFHAGEPDARVPWGFTRESDNGHTKAVPGTIAVRVGEADYSLLVFADGPALVLVFADATTGAISYAPGRFLRLDPVPDGAPITLDFNRAFVPPCGFSDFFSCPIPPAHNRVSAAITAGENRARHTPSFSPHP
ncbi:uncharacterized protein (DUF1684 family) [Mycetocola sp. BIGb0189]|uniref:DUF1684 domain-containing protein n=1 Tax=Mycetocola sp. BIGb0189 TaxID=2940604 RepID=UPI0021677840|nr:DUF1684 domain-containing protein [Mycetocola sp. BIGb0189]MCS4277199.1 uncharacterized protein (DUF1684 family) [Mycetocola sp. BIGb0189]